METTELSLWWLLDFSDCHIVLPLCQYCVLPSGLFLLILVSLAELYQYHSHPGMGKLLRTFSTVLRNISLEVRCEKLVWLWGYNGSCTAFLLILSLARSTVQCLALGLGQYLSMTNVHTVTHDNTIKADLCNILGNGDVLFTPQWGEQENLLCYLTCSCAQLVFLSAPL